MHFLMKMKLTLLIHVNTFHADAGSKSRPCKNYTRPVWKQSKCQSRGVYASSSEGTFSVILYLS